MHRSLVIASLAFSTACVGEVDRCFETPAAAGALRGGWDGNGISIQGTSVQGGAPDEAWNAVALRDVESGAAITLIEGALVRGGERIDEALVHVEGDDGFDAHVAFTGETNGVPRYAVDVSGVLVCETGAVFVDGGFGPGGERRGEPGTLTLSCEDGVIAKCARWGYAPWVAGEQVFHACTRMARADYCGDGRAWTREGTPIDVADAEGARTHASVDEAADFEAGWGPEGATCVGAPRWDVRDAAGHPVLPSCWADLPRCEGPDAAMRGGALLVDWSFSEPVTACR